MRGMRYGLLHLQALNYYPLAWQHRVTASCSVAVSKKLSARALSSCESSPSSTILDSSQCCKIPDLWGFLQSRKRLGKYSAELMAERSVTRDSQDDGSVESRDDIPLKKATDDDNLDDETQSYPSTLQLIPILVGLCLQSICIALVGVSLSIHTHKANLTFTVYCRTTQS